LEKTVVMRLTKKLLATAALAFVMASLISLGLRHLQRRHTAGLPAETLPNAVVVYCFHGGEKSETVEKIQQMVREMTDESFAPQLKSGRLILQYVNYDEPENEFFVPQYGLAGPCLVIVDGRPGRGRAWKAFPRETVELAGEPKKFVEFFRREIDEALK
jgi:hypothetical protein